MVCTGICTSRSRCYRGNFFNLGACHRFILHTDERLPPISKIVIRPSFLLFFLFGPRQEGFHVEICLLNTKQNPKSYQSCLLKGFLRCALGKIKYCCLPSSNVFDVMLFSHFFSVMFGMVSMRFCRTHLLSLYHFGNSISQGQR